MTSNLKFTNPKLYNFFRMYNFKGVPKRTRMSVRILWISYVFFAFYQKIFLFLQVNYSFVNEVLFHKILPTFLSYSIIVKKNTGPFFQQGPALLTASADTISFAKVGDA